MRRWTALGMATAITAGMLGSGGAALARSPGPSAAGPSPSGPAIDLPDLDAIFSPTEPPIDLVVTQDEATRVSAEIPAEGGTLETTGADGTRYTLTIPDGSLIGPTMIGIAPLSAIEGIPFGEAPLGVQLEPSGLLLLQPAILSIDPSESLPVAEQILFGFDGSGTGLFLAEPVLGDPAIRIVVTHFSGYGVTRGLLADTGSERARLGGSIERRLQSQVAEAVARQHQRQQAGQGSNLSELAAEFGEAFDRFDAEVVQPRIAAAGDSCANARLAYETYTSFERQRALVGLGGESTPQLGPLVTTLTRVCLQEEYEICRDQHVIHRMIPAFIGAERMRQLTGAGDAADTARDTDLAKRCLTFRLDFESDMTVASQGTKVEPRVVAKVPLEADLDAFEIKGTSVQEMVAFKVKVPRCQSTPHPANADFEVLSLSWDVAQTVWQPDRGRIEDYALVYHPGFSRESVTIACPRIPPFEAPFSLWYPAYIVAHESEWRGQAGRTGVAMALLQGGFPDLSELEIKVPRSFGQRLTLKDWEVQEAPLLARQTWNKKALGGRVHDLGSFELFHTPG